MSLRGQKSCLVLRGFKMRSVSISCGRLQSPCWSVHGKSRCFGGFTVVELLVSIAVIGLLVSLLLPAVQQVRAASRRSSCSSQLRQVGIAVESYVSTHRQLPYSHYGAGVLFTILPYLEQASEHRRLEQLFSASNDPSIPFSTAAHLPIYLCPADTHAHVPGASSYNVNEGNRESAEGSEGFVSVHRLTWSDVTDGLSQTAFCSERKSAPEHQEGQPVDPQYGAWRVQLQIVDPFRISLAELDRFAEDCRAAPLAMPPDSPSDSWPYYVCNEGYNHVGTPNGPTCVSFGQPLYIATSMPASSHHSHGVNVLMADGSVRFVGSSIDLSIWRAVGTRNGHEVVASTF